MTIHHDKLAYGRLAKTSEELSEKRIEELVKELSALEDDDGEEAVMQKTEKKDGENK